MISVLVCEFLRVYTVYLFTLYIIVCVVVQLRSVKSEKQKQRDSQTIGFAHQTPPYKQSPNIITVWLAGRAAV